MDTLRYYIVPLTTFCGVLGFGLGGPWVWLGIGTFPVLMLLDLAFAPDTAVRKVGAGWLADIPLYLQQWQQSACRPRRALADCRHSTFSDLAQRGADASRGP